MNELETINTDLTAAKKLLYEGMAPLEKQFESETATKDFIKTCKTAIIEEIDQLQVAINPLVIEGSNKSQDARSAIMSVAAFDAQLAAILSQVNIKGAAQHIAQKAVTSLNALISNIRTIVQSIAPQLWKLISKMINASEWSISGEIGTNLFGLQGSVQLEITFK